MTDIQKQGLTYLFVLIFSPFALYLLTMKPHLVGIDGWLLKLTIFTQTAMLFTVFADIYVNLRKNA